MVRVGLDHPLANPKGYAFEHILVAVSGKSTAIVDWFDGELIGGRADSRAEASVPPQVKDPVAWLDGFEDGFKDAEWSRTARLAQQAQQEVRT
jgi:hypothetical protein